MRPQVSVLEFVERWIREREDIKEITRAGYLRKARLYLAPTLGALPLRDITDTHGRELLDALKARGLGPKTITDVYSILATALVQAIERGLLAPNPAWSHSRTLLMLGPVESLGPKSSQFRQMCERAGR